jgi:hypothetical protein
MKYRINKYRRTSKDIQIIILLYTTLIFMVTTVYFMLKWYVK